MKGFTYRLNRVLKIREIEEELAGNELYKANKKLKELMEEKNILANYQEEIYEYIDKKSLSVDDLLQAWRFMDLNRKKISHKEKEIQKQIQLRDKEKEIYLEKKKKKDVLEKLKNKELHRFYRQVLKKEQDELDDIGQHLRRFSGGLS